MLDQAFDTPNRMPVARGERQVAEMGSLSMEFTRLLVLTGDARWFDAGAAQQDSTALPGLCC